MPAARGLDLLALTASVSAAALILAPGASAGTINVHPGPHALNNAIQAANDGDTLRIHQGKYREHVKISKPLRLKRVAGEARPVIDGRCKTNDTIRIISGGVTLDGLKVVGADAGHGQSPSEVFFDAVPSGTANDLVARDTCDAGYGINLYKTGAVQVIGSRASGFSDSGVYVGGITDTGGGRLNVRDNDLFGNSRGAIVEDTVYAADVRLARNNIHRNTLTEAGPPDGVFLNNTQGIYLVANTSRNNDGAGYHADSNSSENTFLDNVAGGNGGGAFNDEGSGNCGSGNSFSLPAC